MARPSPFAAAAVLFLGVSLSACGHHSRDVGDHAAGGTAKSRFAAAKMPASSSTARAETRSGAVNCV
jgi:hypothetical protein